MGGVVPALEAYFDLGRTNYEKPIQTYPRGTRARYCRIRSDARNHPCASRGHGTLGGLEREQCVLKRRECATVIACLLAPPLS